MFRIDIQTMGKTTFNHGTDFKIWCIRVDHPLRAIKFIKNPRIELALRGLFLLFFDIFMSFLVIETGSSESVIDYKIYKIIGSYFGRQKSQPSDVFDLELILVLNWGWEIMVDRNWMIDSLIWDIRYFISSIDIYSGIVSIEIGIHNVIKL